MQKTLAEIAMIVDGVVVGDQEVVIEGLSGINEAKEGDLTFLANPKYIPLVKNTKASAILVSKEMDIDFKCVIKTDNPSAAFAHIAAAIMETSQSSYQGIHESAIIGQRVSLGKNVTVGPNAVIEDDVSVGEDTVIYGGCYIGQKVTIGARGLIYPNVVIREAVEIGEHVIIHSSTVIGSDGFGYVQVDGKHQKIPQFGIVVIEDDVEIGANVTIDRARFDKTRIGKGSKIDNLVQIAHNVEMDENCIIISQVGISGSVKIGKGAILAGQAGVAGHLSIGEDAIVSAQTGVTKSIPAKTHVTGFPAKEHKHAAKVNAALQRLPKYVEEIQEMKERIKNLESLK